MGAGATETGNGRQGVAGRRARKGRKATKKGERERERERRARVHRACVCSGAVCRAHSRDLQLMKLGCSRVACQINMSPALSSSSSSSTPFLHPLGTGLRQQPLQLPPARAFPLYDSRVSSRRPSSRIFLILLSIQALSPFLDALTLPRSQPFASLDLAS